MFVAAEILEIGVLDAVFHFNIISTGIKPGQFCNEEMSSLSKLRLSNANYKGRDSSKKKRKWHRARQKYKGDQAQQNEGVTFTSGAFYNTYFMLLYKPVAQEVYERLFYTKCEQHYLIYFIFQL